MPSAIRAKCPHCLATLNIANPNAVGKKAKCPRCTQPFVVKDTSAAEADTVEDDPFRELDVAPKRPKPSATRRRSSASVPSRKAPAPTVVTEVVRYKKRAPDDDDARPRGWNFTKNAPGIGWVIAGLIGGGIGAGLWAFVFAATGGMEASFIAWIVGALVGGGVRLAAGDYHGWGPGWTAVSVTAFSIFAGKFLGITLLLFSPHAQELFFPQPEEEVDPLAAIEQQMLKEFPELAPENMQNIPGANLGEGEIVVEEVEFDEDGEPVPMNGEDAMEVAEPANDVRVIRASAGSAWLFILTNTFLSVGFFDIIFFSLAMFTAFFIGAAVQSD